MSRLSLLGKAATCFLFVAFSASGWMRNGDGPAPRTKDR